MRAASLPAFLKASYCSSHSRGHSASVLNGRFLPPCWLVEWLACEAPSSNSASAGSAAGRLPSCDVRSVAMGSSVGRGASMASGGRLSRPLLWACCCCCCCCCCCSQCASRTHMAHSGDDLVHSVVYGIAGSAPVALLILMGPATPRLWMSRSSPCESPVPASPVVCGWGRRIGRST